MNADFVADGNWPATADSWPKMQNKSFTTYNTLFISCELASGASAMVVISVIHIINSAQNRSIAWIEPRLQLHVANSALVNTGDER